MRGIKTVVIVLAALLLSGCAFGDPSINRPQYFNDRAASAAYFAGYPGAKAPPYTRSVSGTKIADEASAEAAILASAGQSASDPESVSVAKFLARTMTDPKLLCGDRSGDPFQGLLTPDPDFAAAVAKTGQDHPQFYYSFPKCDPKYPVGYADIRVGAVSIGPGNSPNYDGKQVVFDAQVTYLVRTAHGVVPITQQRSGSFSFAEDGSGIEAFHAYYPSVDGGFGISALPDLGTFKVAVEKSALRLGMPTAAAAVSVTRAYTALLQAKSAKITWSQTDKMSSGDPDERRNLTATGSIFPTAGSAQLAVTYADPATTKGLIVLGKSRVFFEFPEAPTDGSPSWGVSDGGVLVDHLTGPTDTVYSELDLLSHLRSASEIPCQKGLLGSSCYAVEVPLAATLVPGTSAYRLAARAIGNGQQTMTLAVGITNGQLVSLQSDERFVPVAHPVAETVETYDFTGYNSLNAPDVEQPTADDMDQPYYEQN